MSGISLPLSDALPAFYGTIAKNIITSGDWLTLHHSTMRVVDKPPLTFWLMALSFAAFGVSEWTLRGWHIGLALLTVWATYALARLALPRLQALLSALILLTSVQFFYESLTPEQHVPLMLFVTLAVYWHLRWERDGRTREAILAWLAAALGVLTIGLAGAVLPAIVIGVHLLVDRPRLAPHAFRAAAAGAVAFLIVAAPWFIVEAVRLGYPFIDTFFLTGTLGVGRYFHHVIVSPEPRVPWWAEVGIFLLVLPLMLLPWIGWFWPALREGWQARRVRASALWVCFLWAVSVLVFFSLSLGDKVGGYLLPIFPPLAVLAGSALANPRWDRPALWTSLSVALTVAVLLPWYLGQHHEARGLAPLFLPAIAAFLAAPIAYAGATMVRRPREAVALLVVGTLVAYGLGFAAIARHWDHISPWRPLAAVIARLPAQGNRLLVLGRYDGFADFYVPRPIEFVDLPALVRAWHAGPILAVVPRDRLGELPAPAPLVVAEAPAQLSLIANFPVAAKPTGSAPRRYAWVNHRVLTIGARLSRPFPRCAW